MLLEKKSHFKWLKVKNNWGKMREGRQCFKGGGIIPASLFSKSAG